MPISHRKHFSEKGGPDRRLDMGELKFAAKMPRTVARSILYCLTVEISE
jgi:hypothetical protein